MPTPHQDSPTWSQLTQINHDRAWQVLQRFDRAELLYLLCRALPFISVHDFEPIFGGHVKPHEVGDVQATEPWPLLEAVQDFIKQSLLGEFYEEFRINSKNWNDRSRGSQTFEARLNLLFERCLEEAGGSNPVQVVEAFELLLGLLREIDTFERDIVFFADEAGVWQFGINWIRILPSYFRCLARTVNAEELERRGRAAIHEFARLDPERAELSESLSEIARDS